MSSVRSISYYLQCPLFPINDLAQILLCGIKVGHTFELNDDHIEWSKEMATKYALDDEGKALRIVLDYIKEEADHSTVFEEIRCNHCG